MTKLEIKAYGVCKEILEKLRESSVTREDRIIMLTEAGMAEYEYDKLLILVGSYVESFETQQKNDGATNV